MKKSIYPLQIIFNLNTRLFENTLHGVTEEQARERISEHVNPFVWIAAHTAWARYNTLAFLGFPAENPYNHLFENFKAYDGALKYPSIAEVKSEWKKVTALLQDAITSVSEEHLAGDSPVQSPIGDFTNGGTIAFFAQHESYDIGQMAFLKKFFTKEAMSYS